MIKIRWGISTKKKAVWFYKSQPGSRSMCWSWLKEDLADHFHRCNLTNLEYLEGLIKLKEMNNHA